MGLSKVATSREMRPRYEAIPEDAREGLRTSVGILRKPSGKIVALTDDCIDPEVVAGTDLVALSCVNATAADHLLHVTRVYEMPSGDLIAEQERCRALKLVGKKLRCQEESLDKEGNLRLRSRDYALPGGKNARSAFVSPL